MKPNTETLQIEVNHGLTVEEMVKAGHYGYANDSITSSNFPTTREGEWEGEAVLVHFNAVLSSEQVLAELDKMGLRAGELLELLSMGAEHPDKQREFPIIALGSVWRRPGGYRDVPCLVGWYGKRKLNLYWFGDDWGERCRFLAFRK